MIKTSDIILKEIRKIQQPHTIIAIDGRCASGKTTLANELQQSLSCNCFHMDDFFLRPEQRTKARYEEPGGNIDWERFREEIAIPLSKNEPFSYRPFDCHTMTLKNPIMVTPTPITVIEGTYCCHPMLWDYYDLHIFLTISSKMQLERIKIRNPKNLDAFIKRWIPLEEHYFTHLNIESHCDYIFHACT